jgi:hypothetical protein
MEKKYGNLTSSCHPIKPPLKTRANEELRLDEQIWVGHKSGRVR